MAIANRAKLVESLIFAGSVGVVALLIVSVGLLTDVRRGSLERESLSILAKRPISSASYKARDPDFSRLYRIGGKGEALYGALLSIRSTKGSALAAALFSPNGELQAIRLIGADLGRQPYSRESWFADFLGRGGASPFPSSKDEARNPAAVSGATESFLVMGKVLERASAAVRDAAEAHR